MPAKKPDKMQLQQKLMELQLLDRQMKQLQQQIGQVEEQAAEIEALQQQLDEFGGVTIGTEILVPVAGGMFAKATLSDSQHLLVNAGANAVVERTIPEAKEMLGKQSTDMTSLQAQLTEKLEELASRAMTLSQELQSAAD